MKLIVSSIHQSPILSIVMIALSWLWCCCQVRKYEPNFYFIQHSILSQTFSVQLYFEMFFITCWESWTETDNKQWFSVKFWISLLIVIFSIYIAMPPKQKGRAPFSGFPFIKKSSKQKHKTLFEYSFFLGKNVFPAQRIQSTWTVWFVSNHEYLLRHTLVFCLKKIV